MIISLVMLSGQNKILEVWVSGLNQQFAVTNLDFNFCCLWTQTLKENQQNYRY